MVPAGTVLLLSMGIQEVKVISQCSAKKASASGLMRREQMLSTTAAFPSRGWSHLSIRLCRLRFFAAVFCGLFMGDICDSQRRDAFWHEEDKCRTRCGFKYQRYTPSSWPVAGSRVDFVLWGFCSSVTIEPAAWSPARTPAPRAPRWLYGYCYWSPRYGWRR